MNGKEISDQFSGEKDMWLIMHKKIRSVIDILTEYKIKIIAI